MGKWMTEKQKEFIEVMNEFAGNLYKPFDLSYKRTRKEASEFISKNIELFKVSSANIWTITNGYI